MTTAPIVDPKGHDEGSVLSPRVLLDRARVLRALPEGRVPEVCVLDPDGLLADPSLAPNPAWACFHTRLLEVSGPPALGVVSCAVGGAFAVLVAEQLAEMGAGLVVSISSAGALVAGSRAGDLVVVGDALRDEGTSYHYLPPAPLVAAGGDASATALSALRTLGLPGRCARTWTTDAPYRETPTSVAAARAAGAEIVEMEAAALYAFATARDVPVVCLAQVTNELGANERDFEKPECAASLRLRVAQTIAALWSARR